MNPKFTSQIFQRWFLNQTSRQFATNQLQSSAESLGSEAGHWRARSHRRQRLIFLRFRLRILRVPQIAIRAIPIWPWTLDGHCHGIPPGSKHRSVWLEGGIERVGKFDNFGKIWKTTPFKIWTSMQSHKHLSNCSTLQSYPWRDWTIQNYIGNCFKKDASKTKIHPPSQGGGIVSSRPRTWRFLILAILAILGVLLLLPGQLGQILPAAARAKTNGRRRSAGEGMARLETSRPRGLLFLLATCRDSNALNTLLQLWRQVSGSWGVRISIIYIYLILFECWVKLQRKSKFHRGKV